MEDVKHTLKQWMIDMTGPEDAWAREQYAELVRAAKYAVKTDEPKAAKLYEALKAAGEIE